MERRRILQLSSALLIAKLGFPLPALAQTSETFVRRRLRFTLTFSNPFNHVLENQFFWCYLPINQTATQRLQTVDVSMSHQLRTDVLEHCILELSFPHFPPLAQKVVTVTAEVKTSAVAQTQTIDPNAWLAPERFIESDDARILALTSELRRPSKIDTIRNIYEWVYRNVSYAGYLAEDLGALQAFLYRRGDCTDYADLVVALARASGIPARMIGGYVVQSDSAPRPQDYHNWAEVWLEGAWRLVDAQKRNWWSSSEQYVAFRIYRDAVINSIGLLSRYRIEGDLQATF